MGVNRIGTPLPLLQLKHLLLAVDRSHPHELRARHRLLLLLLLLLLAGLAEGRQQRGIGGEGRHAEPVGVVGDEGGARHEAQARGGDAAGPRGWPGARLLNYDKNIMRLTSVQPYSTKSKPANY